MVKNVSFLAGKATFLQKDVDTLYYIIYILNILTARARAARSWAR